MSQPPKQYHRPPQAKPPLLSTVRPIQKDTQVPPQILYRFQYSSLCCSVQQTPSLQKIMSNKLGRQWRESVGLNNADIYKGMDGMFLTGQGQSNVDLNQTRFIKRACQDNRYDLFDQNGQFLKQSQFFDSNVSRLIGINLQQPNAYQIYRKNAILSQRKNQLKKKPIKIILQLGKMRFTKHPLFLQQNKQFKQLLKPMQRLNKLRIHPILPKIQQSRQQLLRKLAQVQQNQRTQQNIKIIRQIQEQIQLLKDRYQSIRGKIQADMKSAIQIWKRVKQAREYSNMINVPYKLVAKQYESQGKLQIMLALANQRISLDKTLKDTQLSQNQKQRRQDIKNQKYFCKIYINNQYVGQSDPVNLSWPNFQLSFNYRFSMYVYNKPSNAIVHLYKKGIFNQFIDQLRLEIPGQYTKTVISTQRLFKKIPFYQNGKQIRKIQSQLKIRQDAQLRAKLDVQQNKAGFLQYRHQWSSCPGKIPSSAFVSDDTTQDLSNWDTKQKNVYYFPQLDNKLIDPNDPRNKTEKIIFKRDQQQIQYSILPFKNIQSKRLFLLKARSHNPDLAGIQIPLSQQRIDKDDQLDRILRRQLSTQYLHNIKEQQFFFDPTTGFFQLQQKQSLDKSRRILKRLQKIQNQQRIILKKKRQGKVYQLLDQIISQFTFQEAVNPLLIFCQQLFTQKRPLAPQPKIISNKQSTEPVQFYSIAFHIGSGSRVPLRLDSVGQMQQFKNKGLSQISKMNKQIQQQNLGKMVLLSLIGSNYPPQNQFPYPHGGQGYQSDGFQHGPSGYQQGYQQGYGGYQQGYGGYQHRYGGYQSNMGGGIVGQAFIGSGYGNRFGAPPQPATRGGSQQRFTGMMGQAFGLRNQQKEPSPIQKLQRVSSVIQLKQYWVGKLHQLKRFTRSSQGSFPQWNQTIEVKVSNKKQQVQNLYSNNSKIAILLFDKKIQTYDLANPLKKTSKIRKYYLGHTQVSFKDMLYMPKLNQKIRLSRPLILFGYSTVDADIFKYQLAVDRKGKQSPSQVTSLTMDINVHPMQTGIQNIQLKHTPGYQNTIFLNHAANWLLQLQKKPQLSKRYIKLFGKNDTGKSVFLPRFISPIQPPDVYQNSVAKSKILISCQVCFINSEKVKSIFSLIYSVSLSNNLTNIEYKVL